MGEISGLLEFFVKPRESNQSYEVYTRAFAAFVKFNYIPLVLIIELNLRYFLNSLRRLPRGHFPQFFKFK
jgi:hypothetical protein